MKVIDYCPICGSNNLEITPGLIAPFVAFRIFGWQPTSMSVNNDPNQVIYTMPACNSLRCLEPDCGFYFCDVRYDDQEMGKLYANYREGDYLAQRVEFEPHYAALNESLDHETVDYFDDMERFIMQAIPNRPKRVLDWGGNNGINTPFRDAEIHIYDLTDKPLYCGVMVEEPDPPYDVIVCSNTLEHVSYPRRVLREIMRAMDKDTVLYLEVPIENQTYKAWHEHINKFTELSLAKLVEVSNLETVYTTTFPPPLHGYESLLGVTCRLRAP